MRQRLDNFNVQEQRADIQCGGRQPEQERSRIEQDHDYLVQAKAERREKSKVSLYKGDTESNIGKMKVHGKHQPHLCLDNARSKSRGSIPMDPVRRGAKVDDAVAKESAVEKGLILEVRLAERRSNRRLSIFSAMLVVALAEATQPWIWSTLNSRFGKRRFISSSASS